MPQARDLYLQLRQQMVEQSKIFFEEHVNMSVKVGDVPTMTITEFKQWLDRYPFIRSIIKESMMPRVWTLQSDICAVKPLQMQHASGILRQKTGDSTTIEGTLNSSKGSEMGGVSCITPNAKEK